MLLSNRRDAARGSSREVVEMRDISTPEDAVEPPRTDLVLRTPPNWTAVICFGLVAGLHFVNAITSLCAGRGAGYMSLVFGSIFSSAAFIAYRFGREIAFLGRSRVLVLRTGVGRFSARRIVPFAQVRGVRLTLEQGGRHPNAIIELLCPGEDIECPPTKIPRQQSLFLATLVSCPLIKVAAGEFASDEEMVDGDAVEPHASRL
jgi:hypothetical protein